MKAKFYAFDAEGKQITNLSAPDFEVKENGALRTVTNVTCPEVKEPLALSTLLVFDVSGSMCGDPLELEKKVANSWVNVLPLGISECAITSFSDDSYINSDFTTRKNYLQDRINTLFCMNGTNYDQAFLNDYTGAISIAKTGKHKKVIIFLSDGQPNFEPQTSKIIQEAINNGITIYSIIVKMNAPQCVKDISTQTGGIYFDNVSTDQDIEEAFLSLLSIAQGGDPCTIEWESGVSCKSSLTNVKIILTNLNLTSLVSYQSPNSSVARLEISPSCIIFKNVAPGNPKDTTITITARNADFHIINIKSSNPAFTVDETNFNLPKGQSIDLKVSYTPIDSSYTFTKFEFDCDPCPVSFYCSGGFPGHKPHVQTLKLTHPNGGEKFVVGTD
jgi:uncharacterized protein YegL